MKLYVDTWGWLALEDRKEPRHADAVRLYTERAARPGQIVTSDFVLDETFTVLFRRRPFPEAWQFAQAILESAGSKFLLVERVTGVRFRRALDLRKRLADQSRLSFTDLTTMVIMQELRLKDILTADDRFSEAGHSYRSLPGSGIEKRK